jgi:hypothetical protein
MPYERNCTTPGCSSIGKKMKEIHMDNHYRYIDSAEDSVAVCFYCCPDCGAVKVAKE